MDPIYHITTRQDLDAAQVHGVLKPASLRQEGFIHCSYLQQVTFAANRFFQGQSDLVLLEIDPAQLTAPLVEERAKDVEDNFPHLYGELPLTAVIRTLHFPCEADGTFELPARLLPQDPPISR